MIVNFEKYRNKIEDSQVLEAFNFFMEKSSKLSDFTTISSDHGYMTEAIGYRIKNSSHQQSVFDLVVSKTHLTFYIRVYYITKNVTLTLRKIQKKLEEYSFEVDITNAGKDYKVYIKNINIIVTFLHLYGSKL